ncbi:MAG: GNAT family N-acetyltransferase [Leptolyngbyaceae bacterium]|nr:GNAT family N-acetyltransferase [Leptolyngbyaceae bacterium]
MPITSMTTSNHELVVSVVSYAECITAIQAVRYQVFQCEQQVAPELEFDGEDDAATHLIARFNHKPVGTARIRYLSDRLAKIERVAVLSDHRGLGIGRQLMDVAIAHIRNQGIPEIKINAQSHARAFYDKLGFQQRGDTFEEAGIPHIEMRLSL